MGVSDLWIRFFFFGACWYYAIIAVPESCAVILYMAAISVHPLGSALCLVCLLSVHHLCFLPWFSWALRSVYTDPLISGSFHSLPQSSVLFWVILSHSNMSLVLLELFLHPSARPYLCSLSLLGSSLFIKCIFILLLCYLSLMSSHMHVVFALPPFPVCRVISLSLALSLHTI